METEEKQKFLSDIEAHTNELVRREQKVNKKLVSTEFLFSRYKAIQTLASSLQQTYELEKGNNDFLEYLANTMNFQKIIIINSNKNLSILGSYGYTEDEKNIIKLDSNIKILDDAFGETQNDTDVIFKDIDIGTFDSLGLAQFLSGRIKNVEGFTYIFSGYDDKDGLFYKSKYPLSSDDVTWYTQLIILWNSFITKVNLFNELKDKAAENLKIANEREKQIEERTRSLLDALFDAKKYQLALELADVIVMLVDTTSKRIIYANELFEKISNFERNTVVGRKGLEVLNITALSGATEIFSDDFYNILKEHQTVRGNYVIITKTGYEKQIFFSISRFDEDSGGSIYVIIGRDMTDEITASKKEKEYAENIEKLNRLIVNRELRIIELKKRFDKSA